MKLTVPVAYRKWFILGLVVQLVTAWFSVGYNQPDEHFQVLEYCNYKMGNSAAADLPWEFKEQCRSGIQPFIAYCICEPLQQASLFNPFVAAALIRICTGVLTWWVTARLLLLLLPQFCTEKGRRLYIFCGFFLWFVPYIGVRFSAENFAGLLCTLALSFLLQVKDQRPRRYSWQLAVTGMLLGISLYMRIQMVFALAGLAIWMLFIQKWKLRDWVILFIFFLVGIGICVLADRWLYGHWVFTPYNYYYQNITVNKSAKFGIYPCWYYFWFLIQTAVPPLSILLLFLFLLGLWRKPKHLFSLVLVMFWLGHLAVGHKEMRFLFPVLPEFIFLSVLGADAIIAKGPVRPIYVWIFRIIAVFNLLLLIVRMFMPAQELVKYYSFIYNQTQKAPTTVVSFKRSPYYEDSLEENFYKPKNLNIIVVKPDSLAAVLNNVKQPLLFFSENLLHDSRLDGYNAQIVYCLFPRWLLANDVNGWQERSHIWAIYKVYPKGYPSQE